MSSGPDVSGKVLVIHDPGVAFATTVLPALRESLAPLAQRAGSSARESSSSLAYLWYATPETAPKEVRTVLVRLACLSRVFGGRADDFAALPTAAKRSVTKLMRGADSILLVYQSDRPETLTNLADWQRLVDERRGRLEHEPECPAAVYGVLALQTRATVGQAVGGATHSDFARELRASRSCAATVPNINLTDAERIALHCMQMVVDCARRRSGLAPLTALGCPPDCDVRAPHQHLRSEDEFLGSEHTTVLTRQVPARHSEPTPAEMPRASIAPNQMRVLVPAPDASERTATRGAPAKRFARVPLAPGTALPANSQTTDRPTAAGERSSLLVRVPKR